MGNDYARLADFKRAIFWLAFRATAVASCIIMLLIVMLRAAC